MPKGFFQQTHFFSRVFKSLSAHQKPDLEKNSNKHILDFRSQVKTPHKTNQGGSLGILNSLLQLLHLHL